MNWVFKAYMNCLWEFTVCDLDAKNDVISSIIAHLLTFNFNYLLFVPQ